MCWNYVSLCNTYLYSFTLVLYPEGNTTSLFLCTIATCASYDIPGRSTTMPAPRGSRSRSVMPGGHQVGVAPPLFRLETQSSGAWFFVDFLRVLGLEMS